MTVCNLIDCVGELKLVILGKNFSYSFWFSAHLPPPTALLTNVGSGKNMSKGEKILGTGEATKTDDFSEFWNFSENSSLMMRAGLI